MSSTDKTMSELIDGMTGFDEIAVEKAFNDFNVYDLANEDGKVAGRNLVKISRVAVFLHKRSEGMSDSEAYEFAMSCTASQASEYFTAEPEEIDDEDPDTELGKGSGQLDAVPVSAPPSAS